jgi:thiamine transporter
MIPDNTPYPEQSPEPGNSGPGQTGPAKPSRQLLLRESILATASGGMAIAMGTILSIIPFIKMPQGGSLTPASMLPLVFYALAFGPVWGLGACAVYGILQFVINPFAIHWASLILDYPLAFGLLGLAGLFAAPTPFRLAERNILRRASLVPVPQMLAGVLLGMAGRLACHLVSGVIFYAEYAGDQNPWIYSLIYNGSYMLPEAIITGVLLTVLLAAFRPFRRTS